MLPNKNLKEFNSDPEIMDALTNAFEEMFATGEYVVEGAFRCTIIKDTEHGE